MPKYIFSILWVLSLSICLSFLQRKFRQGTVSPVHFYFPVLQFLTSPVSAVMATSCPRGCTKWHQATTAWQAGLCLALSDAHCHNEHLPGTAHSLVCWWWAARRRRVKVCFDFSFPRHFAKSQCQVWSQPKMGGGECSPHVNDENVHYLFIHLRKNDEGKRSANEQTLTQNGQNVRKKW